MSEVYKVFNSIPFREYREHDYDILDIAWSCNIDKPNLLLSCSMDNKVILWDLNKDTHISIFEHPDVPTKVCFNPDLDHLFVTVCLDKAIRVWDMNSHKPLDI